MLFLACRHHIFELLLKNVFEQTTEIETVGPEVDLFKRFKKSFSSSNLTKYEPGINDEKVLSTLTPIKSEILSFARDQLKVKC